LIDRFGEDQNALLLTSIEAETDGEATIVGTKGRIRLPFPFLCPTKLHVKLDGEAGEKTYQEELPPKGFVLVEDEERTVHYH